MNFLSITTNFWKAYKTQAQTVFSAMYWMSPDTALFFEKYLTGIMYVENQCYSQHKMDVLFHSFLFFFVILQNEGKHKIKYCHLCTQISCVDNHWNQWWVPTRMTRKIRKTIVLNYHQNYCMTGSYDTYLCVCVHVHKCVYDKTSDLPGKWVWFSCACARWWELRRETAGCCFTSILAQTVLSPCRKKLKQKERWLLKNQISHVEYRTQLQITIWAMVKKMYLQTCMPNEDSNQPANPQSDQSLHCPHEEALHLWLSKVWPSEDSDLFVLRFYGPVNRMGSCQEWSVYLTTLLLGGLSPLHG